jgi:drug/metabolite transporter (DMT)-like permease
MFLWVQSMNYTTTVRASLFSNMYPLIIMLYCRYFKGVSHSSGEFLGVALSIVGVALAMFDASPEEWSQDTPSGVSAIVGDIMYVFFAFWELLWLPHHSVMLIIQ